MKLIVTGSRRLEDSKIVLKGIESAMQYADFQIHNTLHLIHGAAKGADTLAEKCVEYLRESYLIDIKIDRYPADWEKYGRYAGPKRNKEMVDAHKDATVGLAFWTGDILSSGTYHCICQMKDHKIPVIIVWI